MQDVMLVSKEDLQELLSETFSKFENKLDLISVDESKEYYTVSDVMEIFDVSRVTINKWVKNGILPDFKIGNKRYFSSKEIRELKNPKTK